MCAKRTKLAPPPSKPINWGLPIWRVPAGKPKKVMVISHAFMGFYTHFFDGRSRSCHGAEECLLCDMGLSRRWSGAMVIANTQETNRHLCVFTSSVTEVLQEAIQRHDALHGCVFLMGRSGLDVRSEMFATYQSWQAYRSRVYTMDDICDLVERVFNAEVVKGVPK